MRGNLLKKIAGAAIVAVAGSLAATANASLVVSLSPTSGNPTAVNTGDTLTFNVIGTVTGTDGTANEGLTSLYGSLESVPGSNGPVGDFANFVPNAAVFSTNQAGTQQDLNGLPGLDIGSNSKDSTQLGDYIFLRAPALVTDATATGDTSHFQLGTVTFHVTDAGSGGTSQLMFVPRTNATNGPQNTAASWREDGLTKNPASAGETFGGTNFQIQSVAAPEPGTFGLAAIGGLGLLLRRRRSK